MKSRVKKVLGLALLMFLQACEEVYKEEQFNVIVPIMVQQQSNEVIPAEDPKQIAQKNNENIKEDSSTPLETKNEKELAAAETQTEKLVNNEVPDEKPEEPIAQNGGVEQNNKTELSSDFTKKEIQPESEDSQKKILVSSPTPKTVKANAVDKTLDPREKARRQWLDLKNFASRRGFSQEDVNNLIPESLSIENYIKFGDIEKTNEKLTVIEEKLKEVRVSRGYVNQKYKKILQKVANSQLPIDEKNDFNLRLKLAEKAIADNSFNSANRELNELEVDLGQVQTLDQVFEN